MSKKKMPQTSIDAKNSLEPDKIRLMYRKILSALEVLGDCTYEELALNMEEKPERIWKRLSEMGRLNLIHRPGDRRIMSSGRQGFTWRLGSGKDVTKQKKKVMKGPSVSDFSKAILKQPAPSSKIQQSLF